MGSWTADTWVGIATLVSIFFTSLTTLIVTVRNASAGKTRSEENKQTVVNTVNEVAGAAKDEAAEAKKLSQASDDKLKEMQKQFEEMRRQFTATAATAATKEPVQPSIVVMERSDRP